jgi:3-hydroxybutyryl-CoA dehydrogenase
MQAPRPAEDIDKGMKLGCHHPIGPPALADMIGLDVLLSVCGSSMTSSPIRNTGPCPLLKESVAAGYLGSQGVFSY